MYILWTVFVFCLTLPPPPRIQLVDANMGKINIELRFSMLELYQENMIDLLSKGKADPKSYETGMKLEIKKGALFLLLTHLSPHEPL